MVSRFTRAPPLLTPSLGIVVFSLYVKAHECLAVTSFNSEIEKTKVLICSLTSWRIYRYYVQVMSGSRVSWFPGPSLFPCDSVFSVTYQGPDSAKSHLLSSSTSSPTSGPTVTPRPSSEFLCSVASVMEGWVLAVVILKPLVPHGGTFRSAFFQPSGTDVIFLTNTMVLSPVASRKALNFKNKSRSESRVVKTSTDRPPAPISSWSEWGLGFLPQWEGIFLHVRRPFSDRQRNGIPNLLYLGSGLDALPGVCEQLVLCSVILKGKPEAFPGPDLRLNLSDRMQFGERRSFRCLEQSRIIFWVRKGMSRTLKNSIFCRRQTPGILGRRRLPWRRVSEAGKSGSLSLTSLSHLLAAAIESSGWEGWSPREEDRRVQMTSDLSLKEGADGSPLQRILLVLGRGGIQLGRPRAGGQHCHPPAHFPVCSLSPPATERLLPWPFRQVSGLTVGPVGVGWRPCTSLAVSETIRSLPDIFFPPQH